MDSLNIPKLTKVYIILSVAVVLSIITINFIANNTLYSIESTDTNTRNFLVNALRADNDKEIKVGKLFSLYVIPNDTTLLKIETPKKEDIPNEEIIKSLSGDDLGLGIKNLELNFTHQYDITMNGVEDGGCTHGKYPNILSYSCANLNKVISYDALSPVGRGSYISTPPTPIEAFSGYYENIKERTISLQKYKDGLLLLVANQSEKGYPLHDSARLMYIDQHGEISNMELVKPLDEFVNGRYQLVTDSGGGEGFSIIDNSSNVVMLYNNPSDNPWTIDLETPKDLNINNTCSLNNSILACYSGVMNVHTHSEEEDMSIDQLGNGKLVVFDSENRSNIADIEVPSDDPLTNLCIDSYKNIYSTTEETIDLIDYSDNQFERKTIVPSPGSISCGNKAHFVTDGKVYAINKGTESHLVYASESIPAANMSVFSDSVIIQASFTSKPNITYSLTSTPKDEPHMSMRSSDIVSKVAEKYRGVDFIPKFSPNSIEYIMRSYVAGGGVEQDSNSMNLLISETKKYTSKITPKAIFLQPSSSSAL